jgi:transcriptional regulator with XRE-family HTH domain
MTNLKARPRSGRVTQHVDSIVTSIGPKLRRLRQEQRLSLQQLAAKADVSAAAIHKIERNDMVPTITTLLKIATALGHPVASLVDVDAGVPELTSFIPSTARPSMFTSHAGLRLDGISGSYARFRGAAAVATIEPGATSGESPLSHPGEELVLVTEGALVFDVDGTRYDVGPGDALHFIGDQPHQWANETSKKARAVWYASRET